MALKDLLAQKAALTEEAIEQIVSEYVRYDADEREVVFTPAFASLSNKSKLLVYLVSLQGWPYVTDEAVVTEAKPAQLEEQLGMPGGTLRPLLKDLKDRHLISAKGGVYVVRAANLEAIRRELDGASKSERPSRPAKRKTKARGNSRRSGKAADNKEVSSEEGRRRRPSGSRNVGQRFREWLDAGYFDEPRTLRDVQARFQEEAIIIPRTSIPGYLLGAVREGRLTRTRDEVNGRSVWVYRTKS